MVMEQLADLCAAHDKVLQAIDLVPDIALSWQPADEAFSLKQIIVHLATANDFYIMLVEDVRRAEFGDVKFRQDSVGWQRMGATDAEAIQYTAVTALYACFERTYQQLLAVLQGITSKELDRPFAFYGWQVDEPPSITTLRQRVIHMATNHMGEHQTQLLDTLAHCQTTQVASV